MTSMYYSSNVKIPYNASHVFDDYFKVSRINLIYLLSRFFSFMADAESGGLVRLWRGRDVVGSVGARDVTDSEVGLETWVTE